MGLSAKKLIGVLVVVTTATGFHSAVIAELSLRTAQNRPSVVEGQRGVNETFYINEEIFNRAFFANEPEFFRNHSIEDQIDLFLGLDSFLETKIARDAELIHILYEDTLEQQASSDPIIRTPDLPNPYSTSILQSPRVNVNNREDETELIEPTAEPVGPTAEPTIEEP